MIADLHVAVIEDLHLVVDGRALCGIDVDVDMDAYGDDFGLRVWNDGSLHGRCVGCCAGLEAAARVAREAAIA